MKWIEIIFVASLACAQIASAQADSLKAQTDSAKVQVLSFTDQEIEKIISEGMKLKGGESGLQMEDFSNAFLSGLSGGSGTGFKVTIYTPVTWIKKQASSAAKEYKGFSTSDVTGEMRKPVLRVIAYPNTPTSVTAKGMIGTSSVEHVVLRDSKKQIAIQPIHTESFDSEVANAMGGKKAFRGIRAEFQLEDLKKIRSLDKKQEFFITVVGESVEKNFKVKKDDSPFLE